MSNYSWFPILFGLLTMSSLFLGGYFAYKFKYNINLLIAFSGGTLVAAALFDILPESFELLGDAQIRNSLLVTIVSFLFFLLLDKLFFAHGHSHEENNDKKTFSGIFYSFGILIHTLIDGLIIGSTFLVNTSTGILIAIIILLHDFTDGISTVTILRKNKQSKKSILILLLIAGITTILGIIITQIFKPNSSILGYILAIFAGLFLYLGASDLLPEAHGHKSSFKLIFMTILGAGIVIFFGIIL